MSSGIKIAIISASAAIVGALISQITMFLISWQDKRHQQKTILRQKYEEMFHLFFDSLEWFVAINGCTTRAAVNELAQCASTKKTQALILLYFQQELGTSVAEYSFAQHSYYIAIIEVYSEDENTTAGSQFELKHHKREEITKNLFDKKNAFEQLIIKTSRKYTKA